MLIAYATSPGQTALDGGENDRNGIYTKHLLRAITVPGMSAEEVFREVRRGVREETGGGSGHGSLSHCPSVSSFSPYPASRPCCFPCGSDMK